MVRKVARVIGVGLLACSTLVNWGYVVPAEAYDRNVVLENQSDEAVLEFHASNVGTDSWQEDILGTDVLPPGDAVRINLNDGTGYCRFDFKTVMESGQSIIGRGIDVCTIGRYTIR